MTPIVKVVCANIYQYFKEICEALNQSLQDLGFISSINDYFDYNEKIDADIVIMVGPHYRFVASNHFRRCAPKAKWIWLNTEQFNILGSNERTDLYTTKYTGVENHFNYIIDINQEQSTHWANKGIESSFLRIGYHPSFENKYKTSNEFDVLFFGSITPRREHVIDQINRSGINLLVLDDHFGDKRDNFIARSKIVLNIHCDENDYWESFRNEALVISKNKLLISESSIYAYPLESEVHYVARPLDEIIYAIKFYLSREDYMNSVAFSGYNYLKRSLRFTNSLSSCLEKMGILK